MPLDIGTKGVQDWEKGSIEMSPRNLFFFFKPGGNFQRENDWKR